MLGHSAVDTLCAGEVCARAGALHVEVAASLPSWNHLKGIGYHSSLMSSASILLNFNNKRNKCSDDSYLSAKLEKMC